MKNKAGHTVPLAEGFAAGHGLMSDGDGLDPVVGLSWYLPAGPVDVAVHADGVPAVAAALLLQFARCRLEDPADGALELLAGRLAALPLADLLERLTR